MRQEEALNVQRLECILTKTASLGRLGTKKIGSERESVKPLILGRILQNHEFGPAGRHVLGLQQQVA
jgi:hypothetical protein